MAVILALIIVPVLFVQYDPIDIQEERSVDMVEGATNLNLNLVASLGEVEVRFAELGSEAVKVRAHIEGRSGLFGQDNPLNLSLMHRDDVGQGGSNLTVDAAFNTYAPYPYYYLERVRYQVLVDQGLATDLNISVTTGGVVLWTEPGVVLKGLKLTATTHGAVISLNNGTVLSGDVAIHTATGGTTLHWHNLAVVGDRTITLEESSGPIEATFVQHEALGGNVLLQAKDTAGAIALLVDVKGDLGAMVRTSNGLGGTDLIPLGGFTADEKVLTSASYPSRDNFVFQLNNTVGGIEATGRWTA